MKTELQSNLLSADAVKRVMPSCLIYALVQSVTFMVDTILAGHFLGEEAVAAVAMGMPVIGLMLAFTSMIMHGGFLKMLESVGRSDMEDYQRMFSITLAFTTIVDIIFVAACLTGAEMLVGINGGTRADIQAAVYGRIYIRTACLMVFFFSVGTVLQLVSASLGYQTERMISSVVNIVVNVVVSVAAIQFLSDDLKIAGLGIGSTVGALAQMLTAWAMIKYRKVKIRYKYYPLNRQNIMDSLEMLKHGLPESVDIMLDSVSGTVVNNIILVVFAQGTSVLAVTAIVKTLYTAVKTAGRGTMYASEPLFGILYGGRDNEGIKKTFAASLVQGTIYAAGLALILIAFRNPILHFYNISHSADAGTGLILIALSSILLVWPFVFTAAYEGTTRFYMAILVGAVPDSILYPLFILLIRDSLGLTGIWIAMGYNIIPFAIAFYILFIIISRKCPVPLERLLLLEEYSNRMAAIDVSIPIESESISFVSENLQRFFLDNNVPEKIAFASALCMEEMAADYLDHRRGTAGLGRGNSAGDMSGESGKSEGSGKPGETGKSGESGKFGESGKLDSYMKKFRTEKAYMDIKAFRDEEGIEIILRNYDEPYDPLVFEYEDETFSKIGVRLVQKLATDISYSYAYHLNVVTVKIQTEVTA